MGNVKNRITLLDAARGFAVADMVIFHFVYDIFVIYMEQQSWPYLLPVTVWERTICITFIFISGLSFGLGRSHIKQSLKLLVTGILVTLFTMFAMPSLVIYYGIIFFLGEAALITAGLDLLLKKFLGEIKPAAAITGLVISLLLFFMFYSVSSGSLNLFFTAVQLPKQLYTTDFLVFLGFPHEGFYSSDYFGVLPWIFMYFAGYFSYFLLKNPMENMRVFKVRIPPFEFLGRHSYIIYLIHQPICYIVAGLFFLR